MGLSTIIDLREPVIGASTKYHSAQVYNSRHITDLLYNSKPDRCILLEAMPSTFVISRDITGNVAIMFQ